MSGPRGDDNAGFSIPGIAGQVSPSDKPASSASVGAPTPADVARIRRHAEQAGPMVDEMPPPPPALASSAPTIGERYMQAGRHAYDGLKQFAQNMQQGAQAAAVAPPAGQPPQAAAAPSPAAEPPSAAQAAAPERKEKPSLDALKQAVVDGGGNRAETTLKVQEAMWRAGMKLDGKNEGKDKLFGKSSQENLALYVEQAGGSKEFVEAIKKITIPQGKQNFLKQNHEAMVAMHAGLGLPPPAHEPGHVANAHLGHKHHGHGHAHASGHSHKKVAHAHAHPKGLHNDARVVNRHTPTSTV